MTQKEIWKDIPKYNGKYQVSNLGRIKRTNGNNQKILKKYSHYSGYIKINLYFNGLKTYRVHRLVAELFIPNPNKLPQVNHKNGIKNDNRVENLEWVTAGDNQRHAYDNKLKNKLYGESNPNNKLSNKSIIEIRKLYPSMSYTDIGKIYGVHSGTISRIINNKLWNNITREV